MEATAPINGEDEPYEVVRTCVKCGDPFTAWATKIGEKEICLTKICPDCTSASDKAVKELERVGVEASRMARFDALCPQNYRAAEIRAKMPRERAEAVRALVRAGKGVLAHGATGTFKTTSVFNGAVRWLIMNGHEVKYLTAAQFRSRASAASQDGRSERFVRDYAAAPWLFIDDLGNQTVGETMGETLLALLEARLQRGNLPLLITSQYTSAALASRFTRKETGDAIERRIRLLTEPLAFK